MNRSDIFEAIHNERERQDQKWGVQNHHPIVWSCIIGEEQGEVCKAILEKDWKNYEDELIQVAAVAVSMLECISRNGAPE